MTYYTDHIPLFVMAGCVLIALFMLGCMLRGACCVCDACSACCKCAKCIYRGCRWMCCCDDKDEERTQLVFSEP